MKKDMRFDPQVVERFNQELDHLLSTGELPAEARQDTLHNEMLSIANVLATAKLETLSKGRISLRNRLLSNEAPPAHRPKSRAMKVAPVLALGLALLIIVFAVSPPLRSWAQEVLARVGTLIITDAPTYAEQTLPILQTATPVYSERQELESLSQEEATRRAGFTVLVPRALPKKEEDMYKPSWGTSWETTWDIFEISNGVVVRGIYDRWYEVRILQLKLPDEQTEEFPIGDADVLEVTVRGQTGYWIEEAATTIIGGGGSIFHGMKDIVWQLGYNNILTWEEDGIVYLMLADDELPLGELLTIAESLAP